MNEPVLIGLSLVASGLGILILQRIAMHFPGMERAKPSSANFAKPDGLTGDIFSAVPGMALACLFLLLTARPFLSTLLVLAVGIVLVVLNRAKERILREPLVMVDAWLLGQIFSYPHLYFPFLPWQKMLQGLLVLCGCIAGLILLEPEMLVLRSVPLLCLLGLASAALPMALIMMRLGYLTSLAAFLLRLYPVSHDAAADAIRNGPLTSACMHLVLAGLKEKSGPEFLCDYEHKSALSHWTPEFEALLNMVEQASSHLPHVLLVQAESFCDVRELVTAKQRLSLANFLPGWDALKAAGHILPTPQGAFGAYTMRTEFSMLTGLSAETMGPWAFNPYLLAARKPMWSLARLFNAKGYTTVCIHSYAEDFFKRDKVMPNLGFQHFVGIRDLGHLPKFGRYTSDIALADFMTDLLDQSEKPVFCFAITMEAHGPWLPNRLTEQQLAETLPADVRRLFSARKQMYLSHLSHMDTMLAMLNAYTRHSDRPSLVYAYGDHLPALHF